jgi:hypothetical protein
MGETGGTKKQKNVEEKGRNRKKEQKGKLKLRRQNISKGNNKAKKLRRTRSKHQRMVGVGGPLVFTSGGHGYFEV